MQIISKYGSQATKNDAWTMMTAKLVMLMVLGQFTFSRYPAPLVAFSLIAIGAIFFLSLYKTDYLQFLIQLFICNHFMFGYENGGVYNMLATIAILIHLAFFCSYFTSQSALGKFNLFLLGSLFLIQILSLINSDTDLAAKCVAALVFGNLLFLFVYSSKIQFSFSDFGRYVQVTAVFFFYNLLVSINQKYQLFASPFEFFPSLGEDTEYEMGILRSNGVLSNFEFYAEYSFSLIALVLPAILTGTGKNYGIRFYYLLGAVFFTAILSIILSGTRSSILLLPVLIFVTILILNRRINARIIVAGTLIAVLFFGINKVTKLIDLDVFTKRSEQVDMKKLTLSKILSGEEMNRGPIFAYGLKKVEKARILFGEGYFTKRDKYVQVHFDNKGSDVIPDYHNLYMSSIVVWGYLGALTLLLIFLNSIMKGFRLYLKLRHSDLVLADLLLGFTLMFTFFLINQFKIQFTRDANYFLLILILLSVFNSLINYLQQDAVIYTDENFKSTSRMIPDQAGKLPTEISQKLNS